LVNLILHYFTSLFAALIAGKLLEKVGIAGVQRAVLSLFAGGLFLLHPVQTESVAYVASRSETLSVFFYYAAFAVFLYCPGGKMTFLRGLTIVALAAAAGVTKEHTLTLLILLAATDWFWNPDGLRRNRVFYGA